MQEQSEPRALSDESVRTVAEIGRSETGYDMFKVLKAFMPAFGLDRFVVFASPSGGSTSLDDRVVLTNWDSEIIHRAMEDDFYDWSFSTGLRSSVLPKSVSLTEAAEDPGEMNNRDLAEFFLERGYHAFVHLPTRSSNGKTGAVSFTGKREKIRDDELMHLNFVAEHAFERLMQIIGDAGSRENPLSEREVECLKAAARGWNVAETSSQIGITTHTVNYHLANAQKKLDARNKLQAVVNAIQRGWLGEF